MISQEVNFLHSSLYILGWFPFCCPWKSSDPLQDPSNSSSPNAPPHSDKKKLIWLIWEKNHDLKYCFRPRASAFAQSMEHWKANFLLQITMCADVPLGQFYYSFWQVTARDKHSQSFLFSFKRFWEWLSSKLPVIYFKYTNIALVL